MILYHYCSTEAFLSIISSRTIRLSSLTQSNDSQEGAVILDLLLKHAANLGLGNERESALQNTLRRAYLEKLIVLRGTNQERPCELKQVTYDSSQHEVQARQHIENLKKELEAGAFLAPEGTLLTPTSPEEQNTISNAAQVATVLLMGAMLNMFDVKNSAFSEEQEWRLVHLSIPALESSSGKFRACGDKIIPYYEVELPAMDINPIGEVILGPRHQSPPRVIEQLLSKYGFKGVSVRKSSASYR